MSMFIAFVLCTFAGILVSRNRAFWLQIVAVGAFMGIGFAIVERDPSYLLATLVLGATFLVAIRRGPSDQQSVPM
jgi:hypothetical protein